MDFNKFSLLRVNLYFMNQIKIAVYLGSKLLVYNYTFWGIQGEFK